MISNLIYFTGIKFGVLFQVNFFKLFITDKKNIWKYLKYFAEELQKLSSMYSGYIVVEANHGLCLYNGVSMNSLPRDPSRG